MQEIPSIKQDSSDHKRWFRGEAFDIFVWQGAGGQFTSLQLCYGLGDDEHILRWTDKRGFHHESVDADETKPGRAMSAILRADGIFPANLVLRQFLAIAPQLPEDVAVFIEDRIRQCPSSRV